MDKFKEFRLIYFMESNFLAFLLLTIFFFLPSCMKTHEQIKDKDFDTSEHTILSDSAGNEYIADRILIGYTDVARIDKIAQLLEGEIAVHIPELNVISIKIKGNIEKTISFLRSEGVKNTYGIRYAEHVYVRKIIPFETHSTVKQYPSKEQQNHEFHKRLENQLNYTGESLDFYLWGLRAINIKDAWDKEYDGKGIIVAVLDTGVDGTHPDLQGQVIEGYRPTTDMVLPAGTDSSYGGSHGTHVAGTIAAKKDGKGIIGVAPGAKIMPIVLFDNGGWYVGDDFAAKGIVWAVNNGAKVLSNSWGGAGYSQTLKDAFDYALENDVVVVAAAGNSKSIQSYQYPANYPGVIQVGAVEFNGGDYAVANFSNGSPMISVCAPGVTILSTMPQYGSIGYDRRSFFHNENGGYYGFMTGTSMATPHVSGLAALILQKFPNAKPWQVRRIIESGSLDIEIIGPDERAGYGLIQSNSLDAELPNTGGVNYQVRVTDAYGTWNVPSVSVSLIGTSETGRNIRYFAKTNKDGVAKFKSIDSGRYEVFVGGPDSRETSEGLMKIAYRKAEERQFNYNVVLKNESATSTTVRFSSQANLNLEGPITNGEIVFLDVTKLATESGYETVLPLLEDSVDFSHLSGRYIIKLRIPQPATADITVTGSMILNSFSIPITGKITENATETYIFDTYGKNSWWTIFGRL